MIITYLGAEFFKVQFGDITLAFNPISKDSKIKPTRFGADIVLTSAYHPDFNGVDQVTHGDKKPFVIAGPGEYEVGGVFIKGLASESAYGMKSGSTSPLVNTIYTVSLENMNICFLGALNTPELKNETVEALDEIDILFVPIGGEGVLEPAKAYKLAVSLEPKLIIPMHYSTPGADVGMSNALKIFLKEAGENPAPMPKLTLKRKDLDGKEGDVVVLESSRE
jgi:L-ascorbate metabolism protein UlaG (beta-lactamase superfamily)